MSPKKSPPTTMLIAEICFFPLRDSGRIAFASLSLHRQYLPLKPHCKCFDGFSPHPIGGPFSRLSRFNRSDHSCVSCRSVHTLPSEVVRHRTIPVRFVIRSPSEDHIGSLRSTASLFALHSMRVLNRHEACTDHDTVRFAAQTIGKGWREMGRARYPNASELLLTADGGGSNSSRCRLWKGALQPGGKSLARGKAQ